MSTLLTSSGTSSTWSSTTITTAPGIIKAKAFVEVDPDAPSFEIDHEAMQASLETLKNIWLAAYSNRWVPQSELDGFQYVAALRMHKAGRMERLYMPSTDKPVYRIIED
jgi:hypothetical protein